MSEKIKKTSVKLSLRIETDHEHRAFVDRMLRTDQNESRLQEALRHSSAALAKQIAEWPSTSDSEAIGSPANVNRSNLGPRIETDHEHRAFVDRMLRTDQNESRLQEALRHSSAALAKQMVELSSTSDSSDSDTEI